MKATFVAILVLAAIAAAQTTPVEHVVIIVKENRSFDHMFGTFPGANGATTGLDSTGNVVPLAHAPDQAPNFQHSWAALHKDENLGQMNGWNLVSGCTADQCYMQYWQSDIPRYWAYASTYELADNFFSSMTGPSFPNHLYLIAAQAGGAIRVPPGSYWGCDASPTALVTILDPATMKTSRKFPCFSFTSLGDVLDSAGVSWKYYAPMPGESGYMWNGFDALSQTRFGPDWGSKVVDYRQFVLDAQSGNLPAVSWLEADAGHSEHPPNLMSKGESWTVAEINAVMKSPQWASTVIFVTWDDIGGFYDHVDPQPLDAFGAGPRVPLLILSPFVNPGTVYHNAATFDSLLAFIEKNWGLAPLTARDRNANNLMDAFTWTNNVPPIQLSPKASLKKRIRAKFHRHVEDEEMDEIEGRK